MSSGELTERDDPSRCTATTRSGERCRNAGHLVDPESGLCSIHAYPERTAEIAREANQAMQLARLKPGLDAEDLPPLEDYASAKSWLEAVGRAVACGQLRDRDGNVVVRAVSEWTRAHGDELTSQVVSKLKARIEELEAELKRTKVRAVK